MLRTKVLAASLATGLVLSGAYALSANAAPTPQPATAKATPAPPSKIGDKRVGEAGGIVDMDSDKPTYTAGESYTITVQVRANTDGDYVVNYARVSGATCQGSGSNTVTFSGTNGQPTTQSTSFTCTINSFPVNGSVSLTTPDGVENVTPTPLPYTIGGTLPGTPTPTRKPTPTKAPTTKPSTGGLASTGV